jgi:uncharacterized membrane protein
MSIVAASTAPALEPRKGETREFMAFCNKCGSVYTEGAAFCPQCGGTLAGPAPASASPAPIVAPAAAGGLQENIAGLLCYLVGFITGIIFLLIDKRPFVRFHAAQSIVVFGFLFVLRVIFLFGFMGGGLFSIWWMISLLLGLVTFVAWIVLMIVAYQGKWFEVPIAAGIAKSIAGSTKPV